MNPCTEEHLRTRPGWPSDATKVGVQTVLRSMLDSVNLFESELAELDTYTSGVTKTAGIKEFARAFVLSSAYCKRYLKRS